MGTPNNLVFLNMKPTRLTYVLLLKKSNSTPLGKYGSKIDGSIS
jgi:hypothetical protein